MSSSKLLEQAIVDAQALRDSAFKSAQATLLEKFAPQIKEAVEKLLEQDEDPAGMAGSPEDALAGEIAPGTDFGGAPPDASDKGYVAGSAKDIPLAATDGENVCPCPDDDSEVTLELNLADLADQLKIGREAEEETDLSQQPMLGGMQNQPPAMGGAAQLQEELDLQSIELDENIEVNLDEVLSEGEDSDEEDEEEESEDEEDSDEEDEDEEESAESEKDEESEDEDDEEEEDLEEAKKKLSQKQQKIAKAAPPHDKITGDDFKALKKKTNESTVKQLMSTSAQLFEEVNLLNARLFYSNQVLKSASLNERQKTHIVEAVSKADSVNEAKAVYETLINSVGGTAEKERSPKSLNEAINKKSSFRLPHKQAEQPVDPNKDRWLKLAGIK
jgi:hypothetical protein